MPLDFTDDVKSFRQMTIVSFIEFLSNEASRKGLKNSVCLYPTTDPRYGIFEWEKVAMIKNMDTFGSDPYWYAYKHDVVEFLKMNDKIKKIANQSLQGKAIRHDDALYLMQIDGDEIYDLFYWANQIRP